jgi:hypothetical protein
MISVALALSVTTLVAIQANATVEPGELFWQAEGFSEQVGDTPAVFTVPLTDISNGIEYTISEASGNMFVGTLNETGGDGTLKYVINLAINGEWYFWGRAIGPPTGDNSFFWGFDIPDADAVPAGPGMNIWDFNEPAGTQSNNFPFGDPPPDEVLFGFTWYRASSREGPFTGGGNYDDPTPIDLAAGEHTFHLAVREDGAYMDAFFLTTDRMFDARFMEPAAVEPQGKLATTWGDLKY